MSPPEVRPVAPQERIAALDVLRGVAVLGILAMNIQCFAMPMAAYFNPTAFGDLTGANLWAWSAIHVLADQKFMTLFSLLFGAGIVLFTRRVELSRGRSAGVYYRRIFWLLAFGLLHAYLLWYGDVLVTYALVALLLFPFRRLPPRWLLALGALALLVSSGLHWLTAAGLPYFPSEVRTEFQTDWHPEPDRLAWEIEVYRGGYRSAFAHRVPASVVMNTVAFAFWGLWRAGGLMLIGMALFRLGVLTAERSRRFYTWSAGVGLAVGLPLILWGVARNFEVGWSLDYARFVGILWNYWGSLGVAAAYIALVMLVVRSGWGRGAQGALAAVGRMAFSNYLFQTIVATTLFYGHGLGWFGQVSRVGQLLVVLAIWAAQLMLSPMWLRHFRFGPVEWVWRYLTYGRRPPGRVAAGEPGLPAAPTGLAD